MRKPFDSPTLPGVDVNEGGGAGAKPPQPQIRRGTTSARLAHAIWDLHSFLVGRASDADELQALGEFWDEHKHHLEEIMRKGG